MALEPMSIAASFKQGIVSSPKDHEMAFVLKLELNYITLKFLKFVCETKKI